MRTARRARGQFMRWKTMTRLWHRAGQTTHDRRSRRPLVGRREVFMIGVLHVANALRPVRCRCRRANARPPPSY
jgi:hypothetical protein